MANQFDRRLPWKVEVRNPLSYIARPEGDDTAPMARIKHDNSRPRETSWLWWVSWPGRFKDHGAADSKQAAADYATEAYWRRMAATPEWALPVEPLIPPVVATLPNLSNDELEALAVRYHRAVAFGNSGVESDRSRDLQVHYAIGDERRRRGWRPQPRTYGEP